MTALRTLQGIPGVGLPVRRRTLRLSPYTIYASVIVIGVFGSMTWRWFSTVIPETLSTVTGDQSLGPAFVLCWLLTASGCLLLVLGAVGPVSMARAPMTWCLGAPAAAAVLHRRSFSTRASTAVGAGVVIGVAGALIVAPIASWPLRSLIVLLSAAVSAALTVLVTAEQSAVGARRRSSSQTLARVAVLAGISVWYLTSYRLVSLGSAAVAGILVTASAMAIVMGLHLLPVTRRILAEGGIPLGELLRADDISERARASVVMLSGSPLERTPRPRRHLRLSSDRWTSRPLAWTALTDLRRSLARWRFLLVVTCLTPFAGSVAEVAGRDWGLGALLLTAYPICAHFGLWLSTWNSTPGLRFLLPSSEAQVRAALFVTPLCGVLVYATLAIFVAGLPLWWILCAGLTAMFGLARRLRADQIGGDFDFWLSTPVGNVPVNLVRRLSSGWDLAVLVPVTASVLPAPTVLALLSAGWLGQTIMAAWSGRARSTRDPLVIRLVRLSHAVQRRAF